MPLHHQTFDYLTQAMYSSLPSISAQNFFKAYDEIKRVEDCDMQVVDVRSAGEIASISLKPVNKQGVAIPQLHILHTDFLDSSKLPQILSQLDKSKTIYLLCRSGARSGVVTGVLAAQPG